VVSSFSRWWRAPLLEKVAMLWRRYWAIKSQVYFGPQFKSFGRRSTILRPLLIRHPECIEVGERTSIRDGVRLEVVRDPYGREPRLTIGSHTHIEQNVHIVCHSRVAIGSNVAIAAACAIVDLTHTFRDIHSGLRIADRVADEDSFVEICDGAFLGYGAVVLPNVRVGRSAVIGANSVVTRDVPDFGVAAGVPAVLLEVYDQDKCEWIKTSKR